METDNSSKISMKTHEQIQETGKIQVSLRSRVTEKDAVEILTRRPVSHDDRLAQLQPELIRLRDMLRDNWLSMRNRNRLIHKHLPALTGAAAQTWLAGRVGLTLVEVRTLLR